MYAPFSIRAYTVFLRCISYGTLAQFNICSITPPCLTILARCRVGMPRKRWSAFAAWRRAVDAATSAIAAAFAGKRRWTQTFRWRSGAKTTDKRRRFRVGAVGLFACSMLG